MYAEEILANCPDFRLEKKELAEIWEKQGHILIPSVKGHPELAGEGVEYAWGFVKRYYRKHNDRIATHQLTNVTVALSQLRVANIWAFGRRTRDLMRAYLYLEARAVSGEISHELDYDTIETCRRLMKTYRTHRNILDQEGKWLHAEESRSAVADATRPLDSDRALNVLPNILSDGRRLLLENQGEETFIVDQEFSPVIESTRPSPAVNILGVRQYNPAEKRIAVQGVHVNDGGPCLWYASFYSRYGREPTFVEYEKFKSMCVSLANIYRDSLIYDTDGSPILNYDGIHLTLKGFLEWKMEIVIFPVRAVTGDRATGNLVFHDLLQYHNNAVTDWHNVTFGELLILMLHPCNCYPFADIIGKLVATVLDHVIFLKKVIINTASGESINDVKSIVVNTGGRDLFEPFILLDWSIMHPKSSFHFPFMDSTLRFRNFGIIVHVNDNHFDPVIVLEDINDMRALINHGGEDSDEENMMLVAPLIPAFGIDSTFLMASSAVSGLYQGIVGGPVMAATLLVDFVGAIRSSAENAAGRVSPKEKRQRWTTTRYSL